MRRIDESIRSIYGQVAACGFQTPSGNVARGKLPGG